MSTTSVTQPTRPEQCAREAAQLREGGTSQRLLRRTTTTIVRDTYSPTRAWPHRGADGGLARARIPGDGACLGYLWMLVGDDNGIKPDRMVLRWLAAHGTHVLARETARRGLQSLSKSALRRRVRPLSIGHCLDPVDPCV